MSLDRERKSEKKPENKTEADQANPFHDSDPRVLPRGGGHAGIDGQTSLVTVYGVSNRPLDEKGHFTEFSGAVGTTQPVRYFKQTVAIGKNGAEHLASGGTWTEIISQSEFNKAVDAAVKSHGGKLGIYTHGIRNAPEEAGKKAAELAFDMHRTFVVEDWASTTPDAASKHWYQIPRDLAKNVNQENTDYQSSYDSQKMISNSVVGLVRRYGGDNVDLVAHSRGSMNQVRTLASLQSAGLRVNSATFGHSDIDANDFAVSLLATSRAASHMNILYNPKDEALAASTTQKNAESAQLSSGYSIYVAQRLGATGINNPIVNYFANRAGAPENYFSQVVDSSAHDPIGHEITASVASSIILHPDAYAGLSSQNHTFRPENHRYGRSLQVIETPEYPNSANMRWIVPHFLDENTKRRDIVSASPEVAQVLAKDNKND